MCPIRLHILYQTKILIDANILIIRIHFIVMRMLSMVDIYRCCGDARIPFLNLSLLCRFVSCTVSMLSYEIEWTMSTFCGLCYLCDFVRTMSNFWWTMLFRWLVYGSCQKKKWWAMLSIRLVYELCYVFEHIWWTICNLYVVHDGLFLCRLIMLELMMCILKCMWNICIHTFEL